MTSKPLRENEIRPDHLMAEQKARIDRDVARLLSHKSEFVNVDCPACNGTQRDFEFEKYELSYVRCRSCETVYVSPRPPIPVLEDFYANSENYQFWSTHIFPASEGVRRERIFRPRAQRIMEICRKHGAGTRLLLEVGAGYGTFCEEMRALGVFERIVAIEPTPPLAESCRKRGLEVIARPVEQVDITEIRADVVASFEVIEHLFRPEDFVRNCAKLLPPGGLLVLTCPNVRGFDLMTIGKVSNIFDFEHLNYFHPASLSSLVERMGFEILDVVTPGKLDAELVRKAVQSGEFNVDGQPFLKHILIDHWDQHGNAFQDYLAASGLSSHMWLVARKRARGGAAG